MCNFTHVLKQVESGDYTATETLLPLVYDELRMLAAAKLAYESPGQTLQPTALVHEAYLRLLGSEVEPQWESRRHFFSAAAEAMRRILIERARRKATTKHGGEFRRLGFDEQLIIEVGRESELLALDEALAELEQHDARAAQVVKLRYFAGLSLNETAIAMQVGRRTVDRLWALAKAWLFRRLKDG